MILKKNKTILLFLGVLCLVGFNNEVRFKDEPDVKVIWANGIPNHTPGTFPNEHNPNAIKPQQYHLKITQHPKENEHPTPVNHTPFGIALNGVLFDPNTNEYWNNDKESGWNYNAFAKNINLGLDQHNAHVQPNGSYHYHGIPNGLSNDVHNDNKVTLIGFAADGFPIYNQYGYTNPFNKSSKIKQLQSSYFLKSGTRTSGPKEPYNGDFIEDFEYISQSGDLDACNGRSGITPEYPNGTYYYVITETFPYIPRCFKGTPDPTFKHIKKGHPPHHKKKSHHHRPRKFNY